MKTKQVFEVRPDNNKAKQDFEALMTIIADAVLLFDFPEKSPPYFCVSYLEEFDEYILLGFYEVTDSSSQDCLHLDWVIINPGIII